ncbi:uncharacterized protein PHALS_14952 [Plasmopara halstedii]|uniref:Uncharacterized protein n=1 Tax=Plasmopara halstedii TaxID=4781 RepID=A0A0P1B0W9_PLAHL|nr:uncharacterized protein PHALS_14952 [Plasmopara halstedii]CEG46989.1 hypothetical protein PHALS_14952 [Plasmopara halstedii]|eukprot:XP_024583358.1 hypothetical protein PHALS_14952 [Plasmopara halstedii]
MCNVSSNIEVLGFLGFQASIVSMILILEFYSIQSVVSTGRVYGYLTSYMDCFSSFSLSAQCLFAGPSHSCSASVYSWSNLLRCHLLPQI